MKDNRTIKERALNPNASVSRSPVKEAASAQQVEKFDERILTALHAAGDKKAIDMDLLDLRDIATFTDYFLITSGANQRQVQAISDEVLNRLKKAGTPAIRVEGYRTADWILMDYGDSMLHAFEDKSRRSYDLDR